MKKETPLTLSQLKTITILMGKCAACGDPVNRYTETGGNEEYVRRIKLLLKGNKK